MRSRAPFTVDVCLIVEGAYPYVAGGVSSWVQDLIKAQSHLTFQVVTMMPDTRPRDLRYELPENLTALHHVYLQDMAPGRRRIPGEDQFFEVIEHSLSALLADGDLDDLRRLISVLAPYEGLIGRRILMDSQGAHACLERMYEATIPSGSFLQYYWSWRSLIGGLLACLVMPLPSARVYHAVSTGYAGLVAARAKIVTGRPVMVTEHGIYTNERRIEILMANWLFETAGSGLSVQDRHEDLRSLWVRIFQNYASLCYEACDRIITLYEGNQEQQRQAGAAEDKLMIIPNGIDYDGFSQVVPDTAPRRPTIALIGRVAPIKDVKTFLRAVKILREDVPDVLALIMGPTDEDEEYHAECLTLTSHLDLESSVEFTGRVDIKEYLTRVDILVLTSLSEAQPLVILEAGAAGIPSVTTDVGCCRELIEGRSDEDPALGPAGAVASVSAPQEIAAKLRDLLLDPSRLTTNGAALKERVKRYYNKADVDRTYGELYRDAMAPGLRRGRGKGED